MLDEVYIMTVNEKNTKTEKPKKLMTLRKTMIYEAIILLFIGVIMFVVETRVTENAQKSNLIQRLEILNTTFDKANSETEEITQLYDDDQTQKAVSIAYRIDHDPDFKLNQETMDLYQVDDIILANNPETMEMGAKYYYASTESGQTVIVKKYTEELDQLLDNIYTENKILNHIVNNEDLFFIVTTSNGDIVYYPESEFIGKKITVLGINITDLVEHDAKWLRINRRHFFTSSITNENLDITITCGVSSTNMNKNSHIAASILYAVILVVFTVLVTYTYFSKQDSKRRFKNGSAQVTDFAKRKLVILSLAGLLLIGATSYYVQTLFSLSMFSLQKNNQSMEIESGLEEASFSVEQLSKQYNNSYLNKAQIIADILSRKPELRTKANLKELSDIFGLQYIMLFDRDGNETLSDSTIFGFKISDNPEDQSYAFNVLKNGVPYVIQEARNDELTGEFHQFIGTLLFDTAGNPDGFMQIAVSPETLEHVLEETSLDNILNNAVAGTNNTIFVIDDETERIVYSSLNKYEGAKATDLGINEEQIKDRFYGYMSVDGISYYSQSIQHDNNIIYLGERATNLFAGRLTITFTTLILCLINMIMFTYSMKFRDVIDLEEIENDPYVDVKMANGTEKRTLNIVSRMMREKVRWVDKKKEEKTAIIVRTIIGILAVFILIAIMMRNILYTEDTIFGFIISNKWDRGFNVFAITEVLVAIFIYSFAMNVLSFILNELIKLVSPKNETLFRLFNSFFHYAGSLVLLFYCLSLVGFDSSTLLASAGLVTVAISLGAKDLITDILAGIFIIFEQEFQVGDIIELNGYKGRVIEIGIRTTRIMNSIQDIKSINNRNLSNIVNKTRRNSYCDVIINVPFDQNMTAIEEMLNRELPKIKELSPYIINGPNYGGIDDMSGKCIRLSIRTECLEAHKFDVRTVVNREIKRLFDENGFKLM